MIWKEESGLAEEEDSLFLFRGQDGRVEAEVQAFSFIFSLGDRCLQELPVTLVKSCGWLCIFICVRAITQQIQIYTQIRLGEIELID